MPLPKTPKIDPNSITRSDPLFGWVQALDRAKEAVIGWAVARSVHQSFAKGRDPFFSTRQMDYAKAELEARATYEKIKRQARTGFNIDSKLVVRSDKGRGPRSPKDAEGVTRKPAA